MAAGVISLVAAWLKGKSNLPGALLPGRLGWSRQWRTDNWLAIPFFGEPLKI